MSRRSLLASSGRFVLLGGANTLATALLVVILSLAMPTTVAFTIAFACGLAFSTATTGRFVFGVTASPRQRALFAASYALIYLVGLGAAHLLDVSHVPAYARSATVLVTAPLSFVAGKFIFESRRQEALG